MIEVTERARMGLGEIIQKKGGANWIGLRLKVTGGIPGAWQSDFRPVRQGESQPGDIILDLGTFKIFIDPESAPKLQGVKIDMVPTFAGPNFKVDYPQPVWDDPTAARVQKLILEKINPGLASHGGYAALLGVEQGAAKIILGGGCQGCGLSAATLRKGIEVMILESIPEIRSVVDMTDHASGENPYYKSIEGEPVQGKSALEK